MPRSGLIQPSRVKDGGAAPSAASQPATFPNLPGCVDDARRAALDADPGPADPIDFATLRGRLEASRTKLPPLYRETVHVPYARALDSLGPWGFAQVLIRDPERDEEAGLMLDIAHAILQNGEAYQEVATDAFQEVVSDLYDGFLSAEDRRGVLPPENAATPPLVKWGNPDYGPYTWPIDAARIFGLGAPIVSLPPGNARRGLFAWAALGHETAGHDVLHADSGLYDELQGAVWTAVENAKLGDLSGFLAEYWAERLDETASDVLGILNMGPAAGLGLVAYFRGLRHAYAGSPTLSCEGPEWDSHPADILRGLLAASTVRLLRFRGREKWAQAIEDETRKDLGVILLEGIEVHPDAAAASAAAVARAIATTRAASLEHRSLARIQNWRNADEATVEALRSVLTQPGPLPAAFEAGFYAAHAVAAAVVEAAANPAVDLPLLQSRLVQILKTMHDRNPSWGPLFVRGRGAIAPHFAFPTLRAGRATV